MGRGWVWKPPQQVSQGLAPLHSAAAASCYLSQCNRLSLCVICSGLATSRVVASSRAALSMLEAQSPVLIAAGRMWDVESYAQGLAAVRAGAKPCLPQPSCTSPAGTQAPGDLHQLPASFPRLQEYSLGCTVAAPCAPTAKGGSHKPAHGAKDPKNCSR